MIALDTNVLIRHLVEDDRAQTQRARSLLHSHCSETDPAFVSFVTLCETIWVLEDAFGYHKQELLPILKQLLNAPELITENNEAALLAINDYEQGSADFADYLIARTAEKHGAIPVYTFDRKAAKHSLFHVVP
jgi:predicted nucleic-acid-binding protein